MLKHTLALLAACFLLAACNTMEGFGKDVQKTGKQIEKAAERHK
jgi:predicted small secreted protein